MKKLNIPRALTVEFHSIRVLWKSLAETRRVDSLLLAWVKYEKQLRRLFCFLVFQHTAIREREITAVINSMAANNRLFPETFIRAIEELGVASIPTLLGQRHGELWPHVVRIKDYRNKLMHGQMTGKGIQSAQLERDVQWLIDWVAALAVVADRSWGYDGVARNTFRHAKKNAIVVGSYPFNSVAEFDSWLAKVAKG